MTFLPRTHFPFPASTPSWFLGHMARSLRELPALLEDIDLVIEARDARLPLTSINGAFDAALEQSWGPRGLEDGKYKGKGKGREKVVVYTKRDLADAKYEEPLKEAMMHHQSQKVLFADTRVDQDVKNLLRHAVRIAKSNSETTIGTKVLVVGMPNVGKSSLLNALRRVGVHKGKAFRTGAEAGITRKLTGTVKIHEDPSIYVYDTPGVMVPFLGHGLDGSERGLKLALTAGIKDDLFPHDAIVDYLLWRMNLRLASQAYLPPDDPARHPSYLTLLPLPPDFTRPTDDISTLLDALASRIGALRKGGERDHEAAMTFIIRAFREGKLGRWTIDDLDGVRVPATREALSGAGAEGEIAEDPSDAASSRSQSGLATTASDLDAEVSDAVQTFLESTATAQARLNEGKDLSTSQERKAHTRKKNEVRMARAKARGYGAKQAPLPKKQTGVR